MSLSQKAALIIMVNIVLTFVIGIAARDNFINPELHKREQAADRERVRLAEQTIRVFQEGLGFRMQALIQTAELIAKDKKQSPEKFEASLSSVAGLENLHYFAVSRGDITSLRPGDMSRFLSSSPTKEDGRALYVHAKNKLLQTPRNSAKSFWLATGVFNTTLGPCVYVIGRSTKIGGSLPNTFIMVRGLSETLTRSLMARFGLDVTLLSPTQFKAQLITNKATERKRDKNDHIYVYLNGDDGEKIIPIRLKAPKRAFDDQIFTPTIVFAFFGTIIFWVVTLFVMNRQVLRPISKVTRQLRHIRLSSNYRQLLKTRNTDEIRGLVEECNNLLLHVADQTEELENYSYRDALTNIANRRQLDVKMLAAWAHCRRQKSPLAVVIFDLDYFKQYNDIYGHTAGDNALKQFANILVETFSRSNDTVARSGGEEFVAVLEETSATSALALTHRVIKQLYQRKIRHAGSRSEEYLTVSAGVAYVIPADGESKESLVQKADKALYTAKSAGRNRAQLYAGPHIVKFMHND